MTLRIAESPGAEPLVLENEAVALRFEPASGAWTGLLDKRSGAELAAAPGPAGPPDLATRLDREAIERAVKKGRAILAPGEWRYAPELKSETAERLASSDFDDSAWEPTPVPSREDAGDRRLKDRLGAFWYRTAVSLPESWKGQDLALIIGAVDDFDTTYFNGQRIGATLEGTPRHWEIPRRYIIPVGQARFGGKNALAIRVVNSGFSGGIAGPVCIGLASGLPGAESAVRLESHQRSADGRTLTLTLHSGQFAVRAEYRLHGRALFSRRFHVTNAGKGRQVLRGLSYVLPELSLGEEQAVIFPDSLPVGDQPTAKLDAGQALRPTSSDGLTYVWSARAGRGLGAWCYSEDEYSPVVASRGERGVRVAHQVSVLAPLEPGESVQLGPQFIWLANGSRDGVLSSVRDVFRVAGLSPPKSSIERLRERILYCGHPGGTPEQKFRGYGGFQALQAYLPTLQGMGVDMLWLLPVFEHGDGRRWNLYSPFDQFQISPLYGTPADLKALSAAAREAGIGLMFDLVPHGPPDHTPLGKEHPEWVCLDEAGKPTYVWGQLAFDNAHPDWQDYMRRVAEHHAREFGVVGVRVDVAAGSPPNWNPKVGYRPSHSGLGGGLAMDRAIREGLLKVHDGVLLLPEEYTGCRMFYCDGDLTYDAQLFFLMVDLQARKATPQQWAASLQGFLNDQALTLPQGAVKMRWTANHDTVAWTFQKKRTREAYGFGRSRALLALCCLIDGVPMIYQGEEDPSLYGGQGQSIVEYIGQIIACRKRLPALSRGAADYQAIEASGGVFACLRSEDEQRVIVLVSMNPEAVTSALKLPASLRNVKEWKDELSGERLTTLDIPMADHQVRVLVPG